MNIAARKMVSMAVDNLLLFQGTDPEEVAEALRHELTLVEKMLEEDDE